MPDHSVSFDFDDKTVHFRSVSEDDHILGLMRHLGTFYESDVLLRIRDRLQARNRCGSAVDAGGFIGTHTVFLSKFCGLKPVLTFEANPANYAVLSENLAANGVRDAVIAMNKAVGSEQGHAAVLIGHQTNRGTTKVELGSQQPGSIPMTTIDVEVEEQHLKDVSVIKVDVEGVELEVLRGSVGVIARHRPLLCVEIHTAGNLRQVLALLAPTRYWIVDCLGYSPTYILEPTDASERRRKAVNALWVWRAGLPQSRSFAGKNLRRLAQRLSTGRWDPPRRPKRK